MSLADYIAAGTNTQSSVSVNCTSSTSYTIAPVQPPIPAAVLTNLSRFASCPVLSGCTLESRPYKIAARQQTAGYFSLFRLAHPGLSPTSVTTDSITVIVTY